MEVSCILIVPSWRGRRWRLRWWKRDRVALRLSVWILYLFFVWMSLRILIVISRPLSVFHISVFSIKIIFISTWRTVIFFRLFWRVVGIIMSRLSISMLIPPKLSRLSRSWSMSIVLLIRISWIRRSTIDSIQLYYDIY